MTLYFHNGQEASRDAAPAWKRLYRTFLIVPVNRISIRAICPRNN